MVCGFNTNSAGSMLKQMKALGFQQTKEHVPVLISTQTLRLYAIFTVGHRRSHMIRLGKT